MVEKSKPKTQNLIIKKANVNFKYDPAEALSESEEEKKEELIVQEPCTSKLVLGQTKSGKSTLCNSISAFRKSKYRASISSPELQNHRYELFGIGRNPESCTSDPQIEYMSLLVPQE